MLIVALLALVAAFAATGTASARSTTTAGPAVAAAPAVVHPDTVQDCNGSTNNTWFHAYVLNSTASQCYGFMGTTPVPGGGWFSGFCGGNNIGSFYGHDENNRYSTHPFAQGTSIYEFSGNQTQFPGGKFWIVSVTISKWSGGDTCPLIN
jgi:hypothetical protein